MVRWFRLFGEQYLGFWALGLVLFVLQEIPYLLMPLFRPTPNPVMEMTETSAALDVCEKILGSLCIVLMVFLVRGNVPFFALSGGREKLFFALTVIFLLANFTGWGLYFAGYRALWVMLLFITAMPPLYYAAIGLWRQNTPLAITGILFLAVHFLHVLGNLRAS